jgi:hypothetical protein
LASTNCNKGSTRSHGRDGDGYLEGEEDSEGRQQQNSQVSLPHSCQWVIANPPTQAYCQKTPNPTPILITLPSPTSPPSSETPSCQRETLNLLGHPMPPTLLPSFFRVAHCKDRVADSSLLLSLPLAQTCFNVGMLL